MRGMRGWSKTVAAACGAGLLAVTLVGSPAMAADAKVVKVNMVDYKFKGVPKTLSAGRTTFVVRNTGTMDHMTVLVKIKPGAGKTLDDLLQMPEGEADQYIEFVGSVDIDPQNAATTTASLTTKLTKGTYGLVCFAQDSDDAPPHFVQGMKASIKVT